MTDRLSILFHRGTQWRGPVRGSTNVLAEYFLRDGHAVTWVGRPVHVGHVLARRADGSPEAHRAPDGALVIRPLTLVPRVRAPGMGPSIWARLAKASYASITPSLSATMRQFGQPPPDVIWSCGGDGGALRRASRSAVRIVQCVDLYEAFSGPIGNELERSDYSDADAVISIGHELGDFLVAHRGLNRARLHVVGQGVDLRLYQSPLTEPTDIADLPRPRLVWVGVCSKADEALMSAALDALDGAGSMVVIGPTAPWVQRLEARTRRVRALGPRPGSQVPAYLQHAQIGLMLYSREHNPLKYLGQNPLKLYEYSAAGLGIISTPHAEFVHLRPPVRVVENEGDVRRAVRFLVGDAGRCRAASLAFAQANGWEQRYAEAMQVIDWARSRKRGRM